jgi:hypothetical protein
MNSSRLVTVCQCHHSNNLSVYLESELATVIFFTKLAGDGAVALSSLYSHVMFFTDRFGSQVAMKEDSKEGLELADQIPTSSL